MLNTTIFSRLSKKESIPSSLGVFILQVGFHIAEILHFCVLLKANSKTVELGLVFQKFENTWKSIFVIWVQSPDTS